MCPVSHDGVSEGLTNRKSNSDGKRGINSQCAIKQEHLHGTMMSDAQGVEASAHDNEDEDAKAAEICSENAKRGLG